MQGHPD